MKTKCGWILLGGILLLVSARTSAAIEIVKGGQPMAVIVLSDEPKAEEKAAAGELGAYLEKMTGARLEQKPLAQAGAGPRIHVGMTPFVAQQKPGLEKLDWDGFVMKTVGANDLVLAGRNPHGTEFAVYRFLHKCGGVRWFIPTKLGEHVPKRADFSVPSADDVEQPHFKSRQWSSAAPFDRGVWEKRNLIRARYKFHHNLLHVFVPSKLYDQNPDWFPLISGKRYKPRDDGHDWQPCFSNPAVAKYAAEAIIKAFDADRSLTSFSLGINDSNAYCQCEGCQALDPPGPPKFRNRPDYSNRVFTFMNRVAEIVEKKHPDKHLGCLAYRWCENLPTFAVNPHIIPYLTNDRAQWRDAQFKRDDQELLYRWRQAAPTIAIYDYYYGSGYVIPRVFPHVSAESIKYCKDIGVAGFYAEIYSNWSLDGPKAWLASQLLWNADQDPDALLAEYYTQFFGAAKEPMKRYWELCERQWMSQTGEARRLKGFFDFTQLEIFPPDVCAEARKLLDEAARRADTDLVRLRVKLYCEGFRYTDLYSAIYHGGPTLARIKLRTDADLNDALKALDGFAEATDGLEALYEKTILTNPLHKPVIPMTERARNAPAPTLILPLRVIADWANGRGQWPAVKAQLERLARQRLGGDFAQQIQAVIYLREHPEASELQKNPSVEATKAAGPPQEGIDWSSDGMPPDWAKWLRPGTAGKLTWTNETARTGKMCLKAEAARAACFMQTVPASPGEAFVCTVYVKGKVTAATKPSLVIQWLDPQGKWFQAPKKACEMPTGETKDWTPLTVFFKVPKGVGKAWVGVSIYDQDAGDVVYVDDWSLKKVEVGK